MGSALLLAQVNTGTISGAVSDATGALVPGAQVTLKNVDAGVSRMVTTNERGRYDAPSISLGGYEITVTAPGFDTGVRREITLTAAQMEEVEVALKMGAATEKGEVSAEAPLVETTTAADSHLLDSRTIKDLPLNDRTAVNPTNAPGVLLGINAVREFRLLTSNVTGEYGIVETEEL